MTFTPVLGSQKANSQNTRHLIVVQCPEISKVKYIQLEGIQYGRIGPPLIENVEALFFAS
jgi:hypothetical protein